MATNVCMQNCSEPGGFLYDMVSEELWSPWAEHFVYRPWLFSLLGSTMVGLTGIFPLLVIPIDEGANLKTGASAGTLKILLSFAVGGLLGDVFLHLLPEAWENYRLKEDNPGHPSLNCGLWVLSGFLVFVIAEKIFAFDGSEEEAVDEVETSDKHEVQEDSAHQVEKEMENNNCIGLVGENPKNGLTKRFTKVMAEAEPPSAKKNGYTQMANGFKDPQKNGFAKPVLACEIAPTGNSKDYSLDKLTDSVNKSVKKNGLANGYRPSPSPKDLSGSAKKVEAKPKKRITGYLNLMANVIDNFTHGLAVGGSFLVSLRLGTLTTFAILIHEIPHEVGDFAILLRSGFNRWDAARAQLLTASGGIFGAMCAVMFSGGGVEARTGWILPFTGGGFLHIGMVTILPELLKETDPKESLKQLFALIVGIAVMAGLTILCD